MGILLYIALSLYGTQVMSSVIEEKSNRIVEVLVSSVRPFEMMVGKIVGVGMVCLTQLVIWAGAFLLLRRYQAVVLGWFGVADPGRSTLELILPSLGTGLIVVFLLFFVMGFLFYASMYAAIGSMCTTIQEAQQLQVPVMMCSVAGWFSAIAVMKEQSGEFARIASLIPPLTPFVVPVRYSLSPLPPGEMALGIAAGLIGLVLMMAIAGRIYRVGILMYGRRASFGEVFRWLRAR
jgi:ABC-2 type transport system permease protein